MRNKLLRIGLLCLIIFGVLLSFGDQLNHYYKMIGDVNQVRSYALAITLVVGLACLTIFFIKKVLTIIFILLIAIALFFILSHGFEAFLPKF